MVVDSSTTYLDPGNILAVARWGPASGGFQRSREARDGGARERQRGLCEERHVHADDRTTDVWETEPFGITM